MMLATPEAVRTASARSGSLHLVVGHPSHLQALPNNRKIVADLSCASRLRMAKCSHENEHDTGPRKQRTSLARHLPQQRWNVARDDIHQKQNLQNPRWRCPLVREMDGPMSEITKYLAAIGARGGKAGTGKAKARTKAQARAAAKARWAKAPKRRMPNDQAQRPGLTAGVERNETKGKANE